MNENNPQRIIVINHTQLSEEEIIKIIDQMDTNTSYLEAMPDK